MVWQTLLHQVLVEFVASYSNTVDEGNENKK